MQTTQPPSISLVSLAIAIVHIRFGPKLKPDYHSDREWTELRLREFVLDLNSTRIEGD